LADGEGISKIF